MIAMNVSRFLVCLTALICIGGFGHDACADPGWVNVQDYFLENWQDEEQLDLREHIQRAINENPRVYFPGGNDADAPLRYHTTTGIVVPPHHQVDFAPHHRLVRLPSKGHMIELQDGARLSGAIIDGNKYNHWPEFEDLGKNDSAVQIHNHCVVEDVVVYNTPGIAFYSYGDYNKVYRCLAENTGYIDVKFGAMYYQGSRDRWSSDGFYFRGTGNLIKDCEAYDTQRWDFCSSHSGARQNTYVDCRGGDVEFRSYGFIDIEGADANNRLIRCISPNTNIAIPGSARTEVVQCMASYITLYDHQNADTVNMYGGGAQGTLLDGNITTDGGIVYGGWSSQRDQLVPGGASPIIVNNRMYKMHAGPSDQYSDWSFSVHSTDGHGVVANNLLFEFDDGYTRGPGMNLEGLEGQNNQVVYGEWELDLPTPRLRYGYYDREHIQSRAEARAEEALAEYIERGGFAGRIVAVRWLPFKAKFLKEPEDRAEAAGWRSGIPADTEELLELPTTQHWNFTIGEYHGAGWYFLEFTLPEKADGHSVYLFAAGIDSEGQIFLNGELVGEHDQWDAPSLHPVDASSFNRARSTQLLAVRVSTSGGLGGMYAPVALLFADK